MVLNSDDFCKFLAVCTFLGRTEAYYYVLRLFSTCLRLPSAYGVCVRCPFVSRTAVRRPLGVRGLGSV